MILIEFVCHIGLRSLIDGHLDPIFNISKRSMMPEWLQLDSSSTMPKQKESTKKKNFKIKFKVILVFYRTTCRMYTDVRPQTWICCMFSIDPIITFK